MLSINITSSWRWTAPYPTKACVMRRAVPVARRLGVREELMSGDYRALFLGWLAGFDAEEWRNPKDRAVAMPPVPAGLDRLGPALTALTQHFQIDRDTLAAAAGLTPNHSPNSASITAVLEKLPVSQMRSLLQRVAEGDGSKVMSELRSLQPTSKRPPGYRNCAMHTSRPVHTPISRKG